MQKDSKRQHAAAAVDEARRGPENERKVCVVVSSRGVQKEKRSSEKDSNLIEKALVQYIPVEHSYLYG